MGRRIDTITKFIRKGNELVAVDIPRHLEEEFVKLTLASAVKDPNNPFVGEEKFKKWIQKASSIKTAFQGEFAI